MTKSKTSIILRGLASVSLLIGAIVMLLSRQKVHIDPPGADFIARYSDWDCFMTVMILNFIGSIYNLAIIFLCVGSLLWRPVIILDMFLIMINGGSVAAAWQTIALIKKGAHQVGWFPICKIVPHFCGGIIGSLTLTSLGIFMNLALLLWTLNYLLNYFLVEE